MDNGQFKPKGSMGEGSWNLELQSSFPQQTDPLKFEKKWMQFICIKNSRIVKSLAQVGWQS